MTAHDLQQLHDALPILIPLALTTFAFARQEPAAASE